MITINIGFWLIPTFVTVLALVMAGPIAKDNRFMRFTSGLNFGVIDFDYFFRWLVAYGTAIGVSAIAWIIFFMTGAS